MRASTPARKERVVAAPGPVSLQTMPSLTEVYVMPGTPVGHVPPDPTALLVPQPTRQVASPPRLATRVIALRNRFLASKDMPWLLRVRTAVPAQEFHTAPPVR